MPDREKVIRGYGCCLEEECNECPFVDGVYCTAILKKGKGMVEIPVDLAKDVLALLKAKEPRVLTLEEVAGKTRDDVVYLEHMDGGLICQPAIPLGDSPFDDAYLNFAAGWRTAGNYPKKNYGETWRCWTSRPTEEQRREAAWG